MTNAPILTLNYSLVVGRSDNFATLADLAAAAGVTQDDLSFEDFENLPDFEMPAAPPRPIAQKVVYGLDGEHLGWVLYFDTPVEFEGR